MNLLFDPPLERPNVEHAVIYDAEASARVGHVTCNFANQNQKPDAYIKSLFIHENYRGEGGAAKTVLLKLEEELSRRGFKGVSILVKGMHTRAFFARNGYITYKPGTPEDTYVRYEKNLVARGESGKIDLYLEQKHSKYSPQYSLCAYDRANDDDFVGRVSFPSDPEQKMFSESINNLEARFAYRGKGGAATMLMAHAEAELTRLGFKEATLFVEAVNEHARRFYERRGWECVRKVETYSSRPILLYRKPLTQENG